MEDAKTDSANLDKPAETSTDTRTIRVKYREEDGWHIFQSNDMFGLNIASQDVDVAYADVKVAIEKLLLLNEGLHCTAEAPSAIFDKDKDLIWRLTVGTV